MTLTNERSTPATSVKLPRNTLRTPERLTMPVQHIVGRSRAARKLAWILVAFLVLLPVLLVFVPWQQNVPGSGRVTALDPLDRVQTIPAPVTGRLVSLNVREGVVVNKGDELAVMEDLDPNFSARLSLQVGFARDKVETNRAALDALDQRLIATQSSRAAASRKAISEFHAAVEKVLEAEQKQEAEEGKLEFALLDLERQSLLLSEGTVSEQDQQKANKEFKVARGVAQAAKTIVAQARLTRDAKEADIEKIDADFEVKVKDLAFKEQEARAKLADAQKALTEAESAEARQATRQIVASRSGTILRVFAATGSDVISRNAPLIKLAPNAEQLAVEFWIRGIDAPLVRPGRKVRLQFEGWPAVQTAGWPSVAVGTFGGEITQVDTQAAGDGRVRVMILPDEDEPAWPKERFLRQGVRANGWVQLDTVSTGYEVWRRLNAFPPTVAMPEDDGSDGGKASSSKADEGKGKKS